MNRNHSLFSLIIVLIFWRCAAVAPPSGGPKDTTPPELISADPPNETVRLLEQSIELQFSEYMDEKSFTKGIRFSPYFEEDHSVKFKGENVFISFPGGVRNEMTVVMTISRDVKDEHGVEMANPIQLAYSTGDEIDHGIIRGRVYSDHKSAVYLFHDVESDSVLLGRPDYIAETADDGTFQFDYLAPGPYQLLAIERGAVGSSLDPQRIMYGVMQQESIMLDSIISGIDIRLFKEEQYLRIINGDWKDRHWGEIAFNKPLDDGIEISSVSINDHQLNWYPHPSDKSIIILDTADSLEFDKGEITIGNITLNDHKVMNESSVFVSIPTTQDTNFVSIQRPNKKISVTPNKEGPFLEIQFSRPQIQHLDHYTLELVLDDSIQIDFEKKIKEPMSILFKPIDGWRSKKKYSLSLFKDDDQTDRSTLKDSVTVFDIETTREQGYGGIIGGIKGPKKKNIKIELISIENTKWNFKSVVNSEGRFEYVDIPEGKYRLFLFEDSDKNDSYSYGKAFPFEPSEWFYFSPDTLEVRSNWDIEIAPIILEEE